VAKFLVIGHHFRPEVPGLVLSLVEWASGGGHSVWAPRADAEALGLNELASDRPPRDADLLVSLGGDGTVLRAVQLLDGAAVPILGVNVGTLGYLTEVEPDLLVPSVVKWMTGRDGVNWRTDSRMLLKVECHHHDGSPSSQWRALNETVIERKTSGHTIWMDLAIDGHEFARYSADGLIVATPTGSTAYSLSARGPVVSPRHRALLVTPVSPHMLFDRSLVLDPTESVHIQIVGSRSADVAVDGRRVASVSPGDVVTVAPDDATALFIRFGPSRFHQIVRAKFGLGAGE
jgi:NAD+ kinase